MRACPSQNGQDVTVTEVDAEWPEARARQWRAAPLVVQLGGAAFLIIGLLTAAMAYADADGVEGFTTTDRLLLTTRPLTLGAVGLIAIALGIILSHLLERFEG